MLFNVKWVPSTYVLGQHKSSTFLTIVSAYAATCNVLGSKTDPPTFIFSYVKTSKTVFVIVVCACEQVLYNTTTKFN